MLDYQREFIDFAIQKEVLRFGQFTLKSGRVSPYFFNAGLFNSGFALKKLSEFYAKALENSALNYDMLFGPAYKGIPLATSTATAMAELTGKDVPYAFNRKEAKTHGEGGNIVGSALQGNVLIVDDVITAGTAARESIELIKSSGATPCGMIVAVDRQERGKGELSAIQEMQQQYDMPVVSIVSLTDIIDYLKGQSSYSDELMQMEVYQSQYGI